MPAQGEDTMDAATIPLLENDEDREQNTLLAASVPSETGLLVGAVNSSQDVDDRINGHPSLTVAPSAPIEESDIEAEAMAAQAQQQGVDLIRSHVSTYLEHNPEASYVSWIATLHPENAEVTIDPRFNIPGNPWSTVFEEAMDTLNGVALESPEPSISGYVEDETEGPRRKQSSPPPPLGPRTLGGLVPFLVGFACILGAVLVAFSLQIAATIVYVLAMICHQICRILPPCRFFVVLLYILPVGLLAIFRALDLLLLVVDTVLTEVLAALAYVLCAPLAFSHTVGLFYHQQTRKLPHYVRWACRKPWEGVEPARTPWFVCGTLPEMVVSDQNPPGRSWSYDAMEDDSSVGIP